MVSELDDKMLSLNEGQKVTFEVEPDPKNSKRMRAVSLPLQTVASHCFNVTFRFLSLSKHTEQSPESIPQCLSIGKISVAI